MNQILMLIGVVVIGYLVLKFLWNMVGNLLKLLIVVIIIGAGTYFVKPELLYNVFGKENIEAVAKETKEGIVKAGDAVSDAVKRNKKTADTVTLSK